VGIAKESLPLREYQSELDGIRAIALIVVLIYHTGSSLFSGGYVGVDVFFVLSGYLITNIVLTHFEQKKFNYSDFFERRARRIFPALYVVLVACTLPAWFLFVPPDMLSFVNSQSSAAAFLSNIFFWRESNYFDTSSELKPLLHTWSLAVEFQFYLIYPLYIWLAYRLFPKYLFHATALCFIVSLCLSHWGAIVKPTPNYYLLPTRAWELLYGALVAIWITKHSKNRALNIGKLKADLITAVGLLLIIGPVFFFTNKTPFPSAYALIPTTGAAIIIIFSKYSSFSYRLLTLKPLTYLGLISYSAYLWHQPIYAFIRQLEEYLSSQGVWAAAIVATIILASATYHFIENPFRSRSKISTRSFYSTTCTAMVGLFGFGFITNATNGFENRFQLPENLQAQYELPTTDNGWCFYSVDTNRQLPLGEAGTQCAVGKKQGYQYQGLLVGDSTAGHFEPFWDEVGIEINAKINSVTTNWCYPSLTDNFTWSKDTPAFDQCLFNRQYVKDHAKDYDFIVLSGLWMQLESENKLSEVEELLNYLITDLDKKVIIMAQAPLFDRISILKSIYMHHNPKIIDKDVDVRLINKNFNLLADNNTNLYFITREQLFANNSEDILKVTSEGLPYSLDGIHLSIYGSFKAAENFLEHHRQSSLEEFIAKRIIN
jgi:peptidoglycan/LPS O-acetylase OafA/YrhL